MAVVAMTLGIGVPAYAASNFIAAPTPIVTGAAAVGQTLTAEAGAWAPAPDTLSYQWNRSGTAISGATARTYGVVSRDAGKSLTVSVTAKKANFTTSGKTSASFAVGSAFTTAPTPTISGTAAVGSTLTAGTGAWSPVPDAYAFQWSRNGSPIAGATAKTYVVVAADAGATLSLTVTATKSGYATTAKTSAGTAIPAAVKPFTTAPTPTISGTAAVGSTLTAGTGA
ncbi:carboxypeptidase regulatory-like domain-containing protein, partial [Microbacterium sp. VKM Ac-2923]|nr:carboxypeptidase regulatory-like domain-containing protein [Microbacterium sp. VKM Ac-2923]